MKRTAIFAAILASSSLFGCGKAEHRYESVVQIVRKNVVEVDDKGKTSQLDVEVEWDPCPGDQFQVLRGGSEFAACMDKYKQGDFLPVLVSHWWDGRGYYRWDIYKIGDCSRAIEPESVGSYEKGQECSDVKDYGRTSGFQCSRRPFKRLLATCPWMARD